MNSQPQLNPCKSCQASGKYFGKTCPDCLGAGYTAVDENYEYYLQLQGENFAIYDIKNPPEYRGMLQKQKEVQNQTQNSSFQTKQDFQQQNYQNSAVDKLRNYNEADITPEEWKETRQQFLKIGFRFIMIVAILILSILFVIFKQSGNDQASKQVIYLLVLSFLILILLLLSNSKLFKNIESFIHSYWDEPQDYKKWLEERSKS